jgi:predicted nuclease of predicted toxin-antitoxin system
MKLLVDENISRHITSRLLSDGHSLVMARDVAGGRPDSEVLSIARTLGAIVLTEDSDFGDLVFRQGLPSAGVILLRLSGMGRLLQPDHVANMLATHAPAFPGSFTVITPSGIRTRPLP